VSPLEIVIDGTNFGGKTPLVARLIERLAGRGWRVATASPYRELEVYPLWDTAPVAAADAICAIMDAHRARAAGADLIVWDRGWPTCFISTRAPVARRRFLPLPLHTFLLLNTAENTERKVRKYNLAPDAYPWMHRHRLRDEISYEQLARQFPDETRGFSPTLEDNRFDLELVSGEILAEAEAALATAGRSPPG
jgi:hypothetical protein